MPEDIQELPQLADSSCMGTAPNSVLVFPWQSSHKPPYAMAGDNNSGKKTRVGREECLIARPKHKNTSTLNTDFSYFHTLYIPNRKGVSYTMYCDH